MPRVHTTEMTIATTVQRVGFIFRGLAVHFFTHKPVYIMHNPVGRDLRVAISAFRMGPEQTIGPDMSDGLTQELSRFPVIYPTGCRITVPSPS